MYKNLKWRILSILIVIFGAVALAYPLKEKISLGLDLQGGMHPVSYTHLTLPTIYSV